MTSQAWSIFRKVRVVVFALCTLQTITWSVIYAVLLIRDWEYYNIAQRTIIISLLSINSVSAILLYLMIIVQFRLWLDGARVAFLLLFQVGGTVVFALSRPSFPCKNIGSEQDCKIITSIVIFGGWTLAGFFLLYAFSLAAMSHIPLPTPPPHPESDLFARSQKDYPISTHSPNPSITSETALLSSDQQRSFSPIYSQRSVSRPNIQPLLVGPTLAQPTRAHSQASWHGSYADPMSRAATPVVRTASWASHGQPISRASTPSMSASSFRSHRRALTGDDYGLYRPESPRSMDSTVPSSVSSFRTPSPLTYNGSLMRSPRPPPQTLMPLPNPFLDQVPRQRTPMSALSFYTFPGDGHRRSSPLMQPEHAVNSSPLSVTGDLLDQEYGSPPPYAVSRDIPRSLSAGLFNPAAYPVLPRGQLLLRSPPPISTNLDSLTYSPSMRSMRSQSASVHLPSRHGSLTVPRSPSPAVSPSQGLPPSSGSVMLPAHPRLPHAGRGDRRVQEIRRYGSVPNIPFPPKDTTPSTGVVPNWVGSKASRPVDFRQWRQNVVAAAKGG